MDKRKRGKLEKKKSGKEEKRKRGKGERRNIGKEEKRKMKFADIQVWTIKLSLFYVGCMFDVHLFKCGMNVGSFLEDCGMLYSQILISVQNL